MPLFFTSPGKIAPSISNHMLLFVSPGLTRCYVTLHTKVAATKWLPRASSNHTMLLEVPQLFVYLEMK